MTRPLNARSALPVALALLTVFAGGCANTRPSDPPATPLANECGDGQHISSVLTSTIGGVQVPGFYGPAPWVQMANQTSSNCPYPPAVNVITTCLSVTAVDTWDETGDGAIGTVYVQDDVTPVPQFAATSLFSPSYSPPDLRVEPGNVLDVTGSYEEFIGPSSGAFAECETLPQISGAASFRFDGKVPAPVEIMPGDLSTYTGARPFLSMLVTVKNVTIAANGVASSGRYAANVSVPSGQAWAISNELFDLPTQYPLAAGQTFASVTGIVTYFYSFQLAPRSLADFHLVGGGTPDGGGG